MTCTVKSCTKTAVDRVAAWYGPEYVCADHAETCRRVGTTVVALDGTE